MGGRPGNGAAAPNSPVATRVAELMPQLEEDLARLVAIPSVSSSGYAEPRQPLLDAYEFVVGLLRDAGVEKIEPLELPDTAPVNGTYVASYARAAQP